jgi:hypothetical protein
MKYAGKTGSGAMVYIPSVINIESGIQKLMGRIHRHKQQGGHISLFSFFKNKEIRLKTRTKQKGQCV